MSTLEELTKAQAWLSELRPLPDDVLTELRHRYEVRFTHHSTAIEGNTLTQSETEIVIEKGTTIAGKSLAEHLEIVGHKEALDFVISLAEEEALIDEWEIRQIHELVMKGTDARYSGGYRNLDVRAAGSDHAYPSHLHVPELMRDFSAWLTVPNSLHPIEFASEAHLRFVSIHPFRDGNGRVGRLLMNLLLIRSGYPIAVLPVSKRAEYISSLEFAQQGGDRSALDVMVIDAVAASLRDTLRTALSSSSTSVAAHQRASIEAWLGP